MLGMDCSVLCWGVLENGLWIHEIYILNISESGLDAWQQKKCKTSFRMTLLVITLCFCLILFQNKPVPYRSQLPDYLLSFVNPPYMQIDPVIRIDELNVLNDEKLQNPL